MIEALPTDKGQPMTADEVIRGDARYAVLQGDALQQLRTLPDECVQCIVTSPPYYQLRNYGIDGQIGLEQTPAEFIEKLTAVFRECRRVLRSDGLTFINISDSYCQTDKWGGGTNGNTGKHTVADDGQVPSWACRSKKQKVAGLKPKDLIGIPWMLAFAFRDDGWYLRQDCIWHKTAPMPESVTDRCTKAHEYIFMFSKSPRYYYDHAATLEPATYAGVARGSASRERPQGEFGGDGKLYATRNRRSVWTINPEPYSGDHFATFPTELPRRCLLAGGKADCIVLDPFSGRATTGVVAVEMGMRYIGIELHPEHAAKSLKRLANVNPPLFA